MKILIAADGSTYTKQMLAYLAAHDELLGPKHQYTVIHSVMPVSNRVAGLIGSNVVAKYHEEDADAVFTPIRAFFKQQGIEATFLHSVGSPADDIARTAEEGNFDLLVMGSRGHGELLSLVLGSVAMRVLARCSTPVLLVR